MAFNEPLEIGDPVENTSTDLDMRQITGSTQSALRGRASHKGKPLACFLDRNNFAKIYHHKHLQKKRKHRFSASILGHAFLLMGECF
jgi:hypothetical protein